MKKQTMYNRLQKQYVKLNQRIQKAMQTGRFYAYTQFKQQQLLSRLKRCSFQLKQLGAGVAVVAALGMATPAVGQVSNLAQKIGSDNPFDGLNFQDNKKPQFVDVDLDGDLDMFIGGAPQTPINFYRNIGTSTSPIFVQETGTNNPLNNVVHYIYISFVDIDNDGDMDMFGGQYTFSSEKLDYFENTGAGAMQFVERTGVDNPLDTVIQDVLAMNSFISSYPFFVDIDNDGDQDCFVSSTQYASSTYEYMTRVLYYENVGTVSSPSFLPRLGMNNPLSMIEDTITAGNDGVYPALEFADMDNDGDQDCFFTKNYSTGNRFNYYENTGTATAPTFNLNSVTPLDSITGVSMNAVISLVDIDNDGDLDVYTKTGNINTSVASFYENCDIKLTTSNLGNTTLKPQFSIYPNPSQGTLNFEKLLTGKLTLYGIDGKEIFSQQIENCEYINLPLIEEGGYILTIQTAKERIVEKVFIKK